MNRRKAISLLSFTTGGMVLKNSSAMDQFSTSDAGKQAAFPIKRFGDGRDWFFEKRFGMFIHWGLYSIPAWHEQYQWRANIPRKEYVKLADQFNPVKFNPVQFLDLLQEAGMEYITFTTKHHDGFSMWDTKQTAYNIMHTPYKKDILGMLAAECQKRKVPLCLYYSVVDWHHPNYPNIGRHHELKKPEEGDNPDWDKYMDFLKMQVKELCSNYGTIHGFWWDMNVPGHKDLSINSMIRKLQPNAVINNRGFDDGDFGTPERQANTNAGQSRFFEKPTEACQSVGSQSWGYKSDEEYYSDRYLERSIDKFLTAGANFLLNVGPTAEGIIPQISAGILRRLGKWYKNVKESYSNLEDLNIPLNNRNISYTVRGKVLYLHLNNDFYAGGISLNPLTTLPESVELLNNSAPVEFSVKYAPIDYGNPKDYLRLFNLPVNEMSNTAVVIKITFPRELSQLIKE